METSGEHPPPIVCKRSLYIAGLPGRSAQKMGKQNPNWLRVPYNRPAVCFSGSFFSGQAQLRATGLALLHERIHAAGGVSLAAAAKVCIFLGVWVPGDEALVRAVYAGKLMEIPPPLTKCELTLETRTGFGRRSLAPTSFDACARASVRK